MEVGKFTLNDSLEKLNVKRWQSFNKYYMMYKEVGMDFETFETHVAKLNHLISHDMKREALVHVQNMRQGVYTVSQGEAAELPEVEAFKCLIEGDTKGVKDLEIGVIREAIEVVKKKYLQR